MRHTWLKIGVVLGGILVFALAGSFLVVRMTESSAFCAKCHVMKPMYESYIKSSHSSITCNDCHTPQDNYFVKVVYKGMAGIWDAYVFFSGKSPQVFETKPKSRRIIKQNCIRCHNEVVAAINVEAKSCFGCHRYFQRC